MSNHEDTIHRFKTKFGFKTVHKYPKKRPQEKQFLDLTNQLYPTGRAWRLFNQNNLQETHRAINDVLITVQEDAYSLIDSIFPDNENFSINDCIFWEGKLGLISNNFLTLDQRKQIILNKISFPRNIKARQSLNYIQKQIELNGFDKIRVYENKFWDINGNLYYQNPKDVLNQAQLETQHGGITQHGNSTQHGDSVFDVIANGINDESFSTGGNEFLWATFFIASKDSLYQKGEVDFKRKQEFKELILKLKPAHLVAFTLINYT